MNKASTSKWFFLFLIAFSSTFIIAQDKPYDVFDYTSPGDYTIAGVEVKGAENRDKNAILSIARLKEGKKIKIPGEDISNGLKALWKLRLFDNIEINQTSVEGDKIYLEIVLTERPTLSRHTYRGIKKVNHDDLNEKLEDIIRKGSIVTDDIKNLCALKIKEYYIEKGFLNPSVNIIEEPDELKDNSIKLIFDISKNDRIKISNIDFIGNEEISNRKLRKKMKETKRKANLFKKSKYVKSDYKTDKNNVIDFYNTQGYRDATIVTDTFYMNDDNDMEIEMRITEGKQYYFGDIDWVGNTKYTDEQLSTILGISKGDIYNPEVLEKRLSFSLDGRDVSSLYLDDGYLFFSVDPVEKSIKDHFVNLNMTIYEGAQATIDNVVIKGNDRTHEHVVRRELRTRPGEKFSRSDIIRSQREIMNLGYFNPESMDIQTPVNPEQGTVDIVYDLEERPSDQLELSAGYGGNSGLIGTLGVTFNNFSIRNIKDRSTWSPLPQGDGQKVNVRFQSNGRFFKSGNLSFTEPWLGGKRPNSLTVGGAWTDFDLSILGQGQLTIWRGFAGLGSQMKWPDDFFSRNTTLTLELIDMNEYRNGQFSVRQNGERVDIVSGRFKNFSLRQIFQRSSVNEPLYPRRGSRISLSAQLTFPYSLFRGDDYYKLDEDDRAFIENDLLAERGPGNPPSEAELKSAYLQEENSRKFEWLEYHKWRLDVEWYYNIVDKLVFAFNAKMGLLGSYNKNIGVSPFERFELGGDGLSNQTIGITGKDIISLRGYEVSDLAENQEGGAALFNKFTMEMRYPLSLNPSSTIYGLAFIQGGNSWGGFEDYNPFNLRRSAGLGARIFLPMFGLLGFDYGWGFDKTSNFGRLSVVLGFEPD